MIERSPMDNVFRVGAVTGRILSSTGVPAAGIAVNATTAAGDQRVSYSAKTSGSGHYRLHGIPEGRYHITAGLSGIPTYYPGVSQITAAAVVSIRAGETATNIDFPLAIPLNGLRVSGRVIRPASQKAQPGERVVLTGPGDKPTAPFNIPFRQESAVRSDGSFEFFVLRAGTYALSASSAFLVQPVSIVVTDKDVAGIELQLKEVEAASVANVEGVSVSGRVIDRRGSSSVRPNRVLLSGAAQTLEADVDGAGSFEFPTVLPGKYVLRAAKPGAPDELEDSFQTMSVEVGHNNLSGIEFVLPATRTLRTRIVVEDGGPIIPGGFRILATNSSGRRIKPGRLGPWDDGTLWLWLPDGEYRFAVNTRDEYVLKSLTCGSTNLLLEPFKISDSTSSAPEIQLVLRLAKSAKVSGRVITMDARGETAPPCKISPHREGALLEWYTVRANADWTFETTVVPGVYRLWVQTKSTNKNAPVLGAPRLSTLLFPVEKDVTGIEIRLPRWTEVRGRLILEDDVPPLTYVTLSLCGNSVSTYIGIKPGPDGTFSADFPEGEYWCSAEGFADGYAVSSLTYGSTNLLTERLRVSADDTAELQIRLMVTARARMVKVSGRVVYAAARTVESRPARPARISISGSTKQDSLLSPDGSFEFSKVTPGLYHLRLDPGMGSAGIDIWVPHEGLAGLTMLAVPGRVLVEGGGSLPSSLFIHARHTSHITMDDDYRPQISLQADGRFTILLVPGEQWISCYATEPLYEAKSIRYGSADVREKVMTIGPTDSPLELAITLGKRLLT